MTAFTWFQTWSSVVEIAPQVFDLAAKCGIADVAAGAHAMLGGALVGLFKIPEARRHLRDAIECYRGCDLIGLFAAYNNLASCELEVGRYDHAERALAAMETELAQSESAFGRVLVKLIACEIATHRGDHAAAIELADVTIAAARVRAVSLFEGEALRCKGTALRESGRVHEAVLALEASLGIHNHSAPGLGVKRVAAELSLACVLAGDIRAVPFADDALRLCSQDAPMEDSPVVLWPLAQALQLLGRDAEAHITLLRAHAAFIRRRNRLRNPRDRVAFTARLSNEALIRAYAAAFQTQPA
jgi:tetratricopeptide (TPR) repeat protein